MNKRSAKLPVIRGGFVPDQGQAPPVLCCGGPSGKPSVSVALRACGGRWDNGKGARLLEKLFLCPARSRAARDRGRLHTSPASLIPAVSTGIKSPIWRPPSRRSGHPQTTKRLSTSNKDEL